MVEITDGLAVVLMVGAVLVAAKTHGRQLRMRREAEGHTDVEWGKDNGPFVNQLWKLDRKLFWATAAAMVIIVSFTVANGIGWVGAVLLYLIAFAFAFLVTACYWAVQLLRSGKTVADERWYDSLAWFGLTLVVATLAFVAGLWGQ